MVNFFFKKKSPLLLAIFRYQVHSIFCALDIILISPLISPLRLFVLMLSQSSCISLLGPYNCCTRVSYVWILCMFCLLCVLFVPLLYSAIWYHFVLRSTYHNIFPYTIDMHVYILLKSLLQFCVVVVFLGD